MSHINKKVPKRRFEEFNNTDDWEQRKLGDNAVIKGRLGWKSLKQEEYRQDGPSMIAGKHIKKGEIDWRKVDHIPIWRYEESPEIKLENGDVIFSKDGSLGNPALITNLREMATINSTMMLVRTDNTIDSEFFYQIMTSDIFKKLVYIKVSGSSIPHLFQSDMKNFQFHSPTVEEQQKIGIFLKQLDNTIALHQRKLEKIKALKTAYLSEMFPAEGETKPKRRFAGFTDGWEKLELDDVAPLRGGYAFQSEDYQSSGIPIIRISNILSNGSIGGDYIFSKEQDKDSKYVLPKGAIILAMSGATTGKTAIVNSNLYKKIYQNQRVGYFVNLNIVDYFFVKVIVESNSFYHQLGTVLIAGAQPNISSKEVGAFEFYFPTKMEEQKKISSFFKQLDKTITLHQRKLQKLQNIKKAYLNEMFI
ncbi:restriction endonuclease subunit S [Listeria sp. FSL L7-0478]|uniref:restriction endonuclease subunit S n=1 Tax=Listeria cossartiae TaxID=2838249 RepID=UPI001624DA14|nr:restriction endonuclease subunit S [Listeria cossartiae]MBC1985741.1 restriction endonuclease subunit S [Listeria cossartiae subsp. cossartiae]